MEKPGRRSRVSSVMASFEQTIEKNKESGESSGMYLTNVASNKSTRSRTRTAGARRTFENTRLPGSSNHSGHARRSNNSRQSSAKSLQLPDAGKKKDKNGPASVCGTVSTAATGSSSSSSNYTNELSSSSCEDPASSSWKPFNKNKKSSSIEKDPFGARRLDEDDEDEESENSFNFDEEEWDEGSGFHAPSRGGGRSKNGRSKMVMKAPPEKAGSNRSLRSNPDDDDDGGFTVTYQNPALKTEGSESEAGSALEHSVLCFDDQDESTFCTEANGSFNGSFSQLNNSFNQLDMNGGGGKGEATTSSGGKSSSRRDGKHHSSSSSKRRGRDSSSKHGGSSHGSGAPRSRSPKPPSSRSGGGGSKPVSRGNSKRAVTAV